jgi:hypothetical protein
MPKPRPLARTHAYIAIDGERDYQDGLPPSRTDGERRTVGDYVTMLTNYHMELVQAWTKNPGNLQALDAMRKIAGIAVHCMEDHGVIYRGELTRGDDPSATSS